jgi:class 3 adenylate cyclase
MGPQLTGAGSPSARREWLVEQFLRFHVWPASRKVALLTGPVLVAHVVGSAVAHLGYHASANIDLALLDRFMFTWAGVVAAFFAVSLSLSLAGREGRWLPYAWVTGYAPFIVGMLHLFGTMSTPHMLWYPAVITLWAIYFDERVGVFSAAYLFVLIGSVGALEVMGMLPYAPLMTERSLDAQHSPGWFAAHVLVTVILLSLSFTLQWLAISVRRVQEARLQRANALLDERSRLIRRYLPSQIADDILAGRPLERGHERRALTVFFSDLVGFTEIAERLNPSDLSRVINEYFYEMTTIAQQHGGTVDELSGDAILILFGAPHFSDERDHALRAARMAQQMQRTVAKLNAHWAEDRIDVLFRVRMGINSGVVTIGHFGSPDRMKYTALGTHVNLAARLQAGCTPGKILVSRSTFELIQDQIACVPVGEAQYKGLSQPVMTYELGPPFRGAAQTV